MLRNVIASTTKCLLAVKQEKIRCQNSPLCWKKAIHVKPGITSCLKNKNLPTIIQSNQYHLLPNKTAQEATQKEEQEKNN